MEKIIILSNFSEDEKETTDRLIACLGILFPECEVRIHSGYDPIMADPKTVRRLPLES